MAQLELLPEHRYVIDTSSLVDVAQEQDSTKVWTGIFSLVMQKRLFTVNYAYPELERMFESGKIPKSAFSRLKELKPAMVVPDDEIILETGRINQRYPKLGDWRDSKNRADPWIVAAAKVRRYSVITEEADTGPRKTHKIPWVCDKENIPWLRVSRFVEREKLLK